MALSDKLSSDEHLVKNSYVTKRKSRKSKASRSLVNNFLGENGARAIGRRFSSRLAQTEDDALSQSLLCEVGDSSHSRDISELEKSIEISCISDKSDSVKNYNVSEKPNSDRDGTGKNESKISDIVGRTGGFEKQSDETRADDSQGSSTSVDSVSVNSIECGFPSVKVTTTKQNNDNGRSSDKSFNNSKENYHREAVATFESSRTSSFSHNATRGSFGSPQLVDESPDVAQASEISAKCHISRRRVSESRRETSVCAGSKLRSPNTLISPKFQTAISNEANRIDSTPVHVTPRSRKELGPGSSDRTHGKEMFKKLLEAAKAKLSSSAQKTAVQVHGSSPSINGITSLTKPTPMSEQRRHAVSNKNVESGKFSAAEQISIRNIPLTPRTPKSVHFRDFYSPSPSLPKTPVQRNPVANVLSTPSGNSFKTPEQQRFTSASAVSATPVNQIVPSSCGRVPLSGAESPLPDTQPVSSVLLKDVVAYVEVRSDGEDRSAGVKAHLQELGASVVDRLNKKVTHILFKEGLLSTYQKAMKWHIPLVTLQWIEECKKRDCVVSERLFLPGNLDAYESPDPLKKIKRVKYMHRDADDEQRVRKAKAKKLDKHKVGQVVETDASTEPDTDSVVTSILERCRDNDASRESWLLHTLRRLAESGEGSLQQQQDEEGRRSSPASDDEVCVPLAVRLLRQLQSSRAHEDVNRDGNKPEMLVNDEHDEGAENRPPLNTNSKSRKKLCLSAEKNLSPNHRGKEHALPVRSDRCSETEKLTSPEKACMQDKTGDVLSGRNNIVNSTNNCTLNSSLVSNYSRGKGQKRKLMPLSQSSSPTVADVTLIGRESPPCYSGSSKRRRIGAQTPEEMELTQCLPTIIEDDVQEAVRTSVATTSTQVNCPSTSAASAVKRSRRYSRRYASVASSGRSPQLVVARKSSGVFLKVKAKQQRMSSQCPTLVFTSFPREDVEMIAACVVKLGGFQMEARVSSRTTHVVSNGPRRTLNMLKGIARGCWIVTQDWVLNSLEAGKWLPEELYELKDFSPAVAQSRSERECLGPGFRLDLFSSCGPMLIANQSKPPANELKELVRLCGGQLAASAKAADIAIGLKVRNERIVCLSEKWILDSITELTVKPTKEYVLDRRQSNCVG